MVFTEFFQSCTDCSDTPFLDKQSEPVDASQFFWWLIGILLLTGALLLSARMGIYQETLYKQRGKHPFEALYYTVSVLKLVVSKYVYHNFVGGFSIYIPCLDSFSMHLVYGNMH